MVDVYNLQPGTKYIMPAAKSMDNWTNASGDLIHDDIKNVNERTDAVAAYANETQMYARAGETFTVVRVRMPGGPENPFRSYDIRYGNDMAGAPYKITTGMFDPEKVFQLAPAGGRRKRRTRKARKTRKTRKGVRRAH